MDQQELLRIVRNLLASVVDLVDASGEQTVIPPILQNVRNGTAGFCSMLDEVIVDEEGQLLDE
jgi:hypothetical protein